MNGKIHWLRRSDIAYKSREKTMTIGHPMLGLLAMLLTTAGVQAQTAPATATPPAAAAAAPAAILVDPAAVQALKDMGAHLRTLKRFGVSTELTGERVLADGQKLQHTATADMDVDAPNRLRIKMLSARNERELYWDGKVVTLFTPAQKYYSQVEFAGTAGELVKKLEERYNVEVPMSDLFTWGTPAAPLDKLESAMNAGQDFIDKDLCDHYAFRKGMIDFQIWITTGNKPLPRKIVITNRADEARPQSVSLLDWNLKPTFTNAMFKFVPPKGATKVEIIPVKTK